MVQVLALPPARAAQRHPRLTPSPDNRPRERRPARSLRDAFALRPGWPLVLLFTGYPIWWVLGLTDVVIIVAVAAMLVTLLRTRLVRVPPAFGLLMLFFVWVLLSFSTTQLAAPGAVATTDIHRYLTAGWRLLWYLKAIIVLLYLGNERKRLSQLWICRTLGWMFVWIVAGGLLGVADPHFAFRSLAERVLPSGIVHIPFVYADIHPIGAELFAVFNGGAYRTSAPFAYANIWGLNFLCFLPFFVLGWIVKGNSRKRRLSGALLLAVSLVPVVFSSNRAMWGALIVVALFLAVRSAVAGHYRLLGAFFAGAVVVGAVVAFSPLGSEITARLSGDGQSSSVTRTNLASIGLDAVEHTSPLLGFGATRQVQGSFTSIAGGATATCPRCTPPSFGTQGQLLLVTYTQGLIGAVLYFGFIGWQFARHLAARAKYVTGGLAVLLAHLLTSAVYSADNLAILAVFAAVALIWRSRMDADPDQMADSAHAADEPTLQDYASVLVRHWKAVVALIAIGVLGGVLTVIVTLPRYVASVAVTFPVDPTYDALEGPPSTLDTIARTVPSSITISAMQQAVGADYLVSAQDLSVTASPNTRILHIAYTGPSAKVARAAANAAAASVLQQREVDLQQQNHRVVTELNSRSAVLSGALTELRSAVSKPLVRVGLQPTVVELTRQLRRNNRFLTQASQVVTRPGSVPAPPTVRRDHDDSVVDLANGLAVGVLLAAAALMSSFVRSQRLPVRLPTASSRALPVLTSGSPGAHHVPSLLRYRPGAFIGVGHSRAAAATAQACDKQLRPEQREDARGRAVLVAARGTRLSSLTRTARVLRRSGVESVGVLLVDESRADAAAGRHPAGRRQVVGVVLCVLLFAGAGWGIAQFMPRTWTASAEVALLPLPGAPLSPDTKQSQVPSAMASEAALVDSTAVLGAVNRRIGQPRAATLSTVQAHVVTNTDDVAIRFTGTSPAKARRGAQLVVEVLLNNRSSDAESTVAASSAALRSQAVAISAELKEAARILSLPKPPADQASTVIGLASRLAAVQQSLAEVSLGDGDPGIAVSSPGQSALPDGTPTALLVLGGGVLGSIVGGVAVRRRRRRPRVVRGRELLEVNGRPVLAVLPVSAVDDELTRNAYLRARVLLQETAGRLPLVVSHVGSGLGRAADVAATLAAELSDFGATVALVDGRGGAARTLPRSSIDASPVGVDVTTYLAPPIGARFRALLGSLTQDHDVVLVQGPPATTPDGAATALAAGTVVLTVDEGVDMALLRRTMSRLDGSGVQIRGLIVLQPAVTGNVAAADRSEVTSVLASTS